MSALLLLICCCCVITSIKKPLQISLDLALKHLVCRCSVGTSRRFTAEQLQKMKDEAHQLAEELRDDELRVIILHRYGLHCWSQPRSCFFAWKHLVERHQKTEWI